MPTSLLRNTPFLLAAMLALASGHAWAAPPADGSLNFTVLRNGSEVGAHQMQFRNSTDGMRVDIATKVVVKIAFVPVYRFEHEGHEIWQHGRLARLWSITNDDGARHKVDVTGSDSGLAVVADGGPPVKRPLSIPASLWHEGILQVPAVLNTLDGSSMAIAVADLGRDSVPVKGRVLQARHYRLTGELQRELWYDDAHVLVKVRFKAKDGSEIEYLRR